jgi:hypothetical protein
MPRKDGTGPLGQGPFMGRGARYCAADVASGFADKPAFGCGGPGPRAGSWPARGGRGCHNRFRATGGSGHAYDPVSGPTLGRDEEMELLKSESDRMRSVLEGIERRLEQLDAK